MKPLDVEKGKSLEKQPTKLKYLPPIGSLDIPSRSKKDDNNMATIIRKEIDSINPNPGVTVIERGVNKSKQLESNGLITRSQYVLQLKKQTRFTPAIVAEPVDELLNNAHIERNAERKHHHLHGKTNGGICSNNSFNLNDLIDSEPLEPIQTDRVEVGYAESPKMNQVDTFNAEIVESRNWGSDARGGLLSETKALPKLKDNHMKARSRVIRHLKKDRWPSVL